MKQTLLFLLVLALGQSTPAQTLFSDAPCSNLRGILLQMNADAEVTTLMVVAPNQLKNLRSTLEIPLYGVLGSSTVALKRPTIGLTYVGSQLNQSISMKPVVGVSLGPSNVHWRAGAIIDNARLFTIVNLRGTWLENVTGRFVNAETRVEGIIALFMTQFSAIELSVATPTEQRATFTGIVNYQLAPMSLVGFGVRYTPESGVTRSIFINMTL